MTQYKYFEEKELRRESLYKNIPCNFVERPPTKPKRRQIICVETGKVYYTLEEAANSIGKSKELISAVCKGRTKTAGGYRWRYIGEVRSRVRCIGPGTIYDSIAEAGKAMAEKGYSFETAKEKISRCASGHIKTAYGYRWELIE
jgi:hypothetical protein